ncbi:Alpha/Beta hydrolase protein [Achaetomium macrosporum]|uniref:Alpha/Beta hydrolase protein n=1 Tax=Achaetomium macrosporum TaxID=79813 RepID=A0AAN7C4M6_9PEZI|nr:Alpha/Beta hydrolase protein [Achaetomium macrosporum]
MAGAAARLKYSLITFVAQKLLTDSMLWYKEAKKYFISPRPQESDLVKTYPVRKSLPIRIFFPSTYNPSQPTTTKLPTLLTIHSGGYVVGTATENDSWNRTFSTRHSFLVIALNYAKAPGNPFPGPIYDVEALIGYILSDSSLPVDSNHVALAGWSAGGNLVLAASQLPSLRGRIHAVVPFYPLTDRTTTSDEKACGRWYKPSLGGPDTRLDNPLVSPFFYTRGEPAELDMLAPEALWMACKLAGKRIPGLDEVVGRHEKVGKGLLTTEGDERFAWETTMEDGSRYRWLLVPDTIHGYDQNNFEGLTRDPVLMEDARIKAAKVIDLVGTWLLEGPLKAGP